MVTEKQKKAAKENIKKAQERWQNMSSAERASAQPEGRDREKPGAKGEGDYIRIVVRPKEEFATFRYHDVGHPGHIQRLAGKRQSGSWDTQAWLISKEDAHIEDGKLIPDSEDARKLLEEFGSEPVHVEGDIFKAKPKPNVPEKEKPTAAQKKAWQENIKKAQASRRQQS